MKKDYNGKESLTLGEFREMTKHLDDSTPMIIDIHNLYEVERREHDMFLSEWEGRNGRLYYEYDET